MAVTIDSTLAIMLMENIGAQLVIRKRGEQCAMSYKQHQKHVLERSYRKIFFVFLLDMPRILKTVLVEYF